MVDQLSPSRQAGLSLLSHLVPYRWARRLLLRSGGPMEPREAYLAWIRLEVFWFRATYLKRRFEHTGTEYIDPGEPYLITSLHFGQWGMYPASLNQQYGIKSQVIASGRNRNINSSSDHFWYRYGQLPQLMSGYPVCYSTDSIYAQLDRLRSGRSLVMIADVRERGLRQRETEVDFLGEPFFLQRTVPLLARRARVRILPYLGHYDVASGRHRVRWFEPISTGRRDQETLQRIARLFEQGFSAHPEQYFNHLPFHRQPFQG